MNGIESWGGIASLILIGIGWLRGKRKDSREFIRQAVKVCFAQAVKEVGHGAHRETVERTFRFLFDTAMRTAGEKLSASTIAYVDDLFRELWAIYDRAEWDNAMMDLAKAGDRAERLGDALKKMPQLGGQGGQGGQSS